ncbi:DUF4932 domain-containing protein [Flavobacterium sp.]|uniref:DUF4932 domain-containing protein n=1 Tax=Flavobacterium sp. TaxID=239 RepID=UPI003A93D075
MTINFFRFYLLLLPTLLWAQDNLDIKVDPRMEALSIFYTLATADTLDIKPTPSTYYRDVKLYFEPYKNHESLNWYRNLDAWDGYDMASLGLFLSVQYPFTITIEPEVKYIRSSPPETFLYHFNKFYKDTDMYSFINKHKKLYQSVCQSTEDIVTTSGILNNIQSYYGTTVESKFVIYLDLLNNLGSNAISSNDPHFIKERMFRLAYLNDESKNLTDESPVLFTPYINVVTHEISHLFLKEFIPKYRQRLYKIRHLFLTTSSGEVLNESVWENELDELLVRVCTAHILAQKFGNEKGIEEINNQAKHFKLAKPLYDFFNSYLSNRTSFKEIDTFYPEIVQFLENYKQ